MNPVAAVRAGLAVLRAGRELKNAAAWKNVQALANFLSLLVALAVALGVNLPVTDDVVYAVAGMIAAAANIYFTYATSPKVGLLPAPEPKPADDLPPITLVSRVDPADWMRPSSLPSDRANHPGDDEHGHNG